MEEKIMAGNFLIDGVDIKDLAEYRAQDGSFISPIVQNAVTPDGKIILEDSYASSLNCLITAAESGFNYSKNDIAGGRIMLNGAVQKIAPKGYRPTFNNLLIESLTSGHKSLNWFADGEV